MAGTSHAPTAQQMLPSFLCDLPLTCEAVTFAAHHHAGQRRAGDQASFLVHPVEVAWLLRSCGYPDRVVAAGVLHDVVEDTGADPGEVRVRFGDEVADTVAVLTEDARIEDFAERKRALRTRLLAAGEMPAAIFAADKVSKVREVRLLATRGETSVTELSARLDHYRRSLLVLERVLGRRHRLVGDLRFELETLAALPPGRDEGMFEAVLAGSVRPAD